MIILPRYSFTLNKFHKLHQFPMYRNVATEKTESARPKRLRPKRPDLMGQTEKSCIPYN